MPKEYKLSAESRKVLREQQAAWRAKQRGSVRAKLSPRELRELTEIRVLLRKALLAPDDKRWQIEDEAEALAHKYMEVHIDKDCLGIFLVQLSSIMHQL